MSHGRETPMSPDARAVVIFCVIGIVAGFLASLVVGGGGGLLRYLIIGVIGAFVGGYLTDALSIDLGIRNRLAAQIVTATIGAVIVVLIARLLA
jgi:uncharacterized membrane protein YeaQ/YmgE (transglycosylase-associated protein family)